MPATGNRQRPTPNNSLVREKRARRRVRLHANWKSALGLRGRSRTGHCGLAGRSWSGNYVRLVAVTRRSTQTVAAERLQHRVLEGNDAAAKEVERSVLSASPDFFYSKSDGQSKTTLSESCVRYNESSASKMIVKMSLKKVSVKAPVVAASSRSKFSGRENISCSA